MRIRVRVMVSVRARVRVRVRVRVQGCAHLAAPDMGRYGKTWGRYGGDMAHLAAPEAERNIYALLSPISPHLSPYLSAP